MIINTYTTEQTARAYRRDAEQAAVAHRLAREVRATRGLRTGPSALATLTHTTELIAARFRGPRRWFRATTASIR